MARDTLYENTRRFAALLPANNALLWGARGMGKSSLVKAVHAEVNRGRDPGRPSRADRNPARGHRLAAASAAPPAGHSQRRFLLFCDDLSFDREDTSYKSLKAALEGGLEGRPANVLFYATSNRRHMMPRDMMENERSTAINPSETVEEKVSLSDRFGLWLGFHNCAQDDYLAMIDAYAAHFRSQHRRKTELQANGRWPGRRGAARARAASPGSSSRIWRARSGKTLRG